MDERTVNINTMYLTYWSSYIHWELFWINRPVVLILLKVVKAALGLPDKLIITVLSFWLASTAEPGFIFTLWNKTSPPM